jgi:hypothetical protein
MATASPRRTAGRRIRQADMGISRPALDETAAARATLFQAPQTAKRGHADPVGRARLCLSADQGAEIGALADLPHRANRGDVKHVHGQ